MLKLIAYYLPMPFIMYLLYLMFGSYIIIGIFFLGSFSFFIKITEVKDENLRKKLKFFLSNYLFIYKTLFFILIFSIILKILGLGRIIETSTFTIGSILFYIVFLWKAYRNYIKIEITKYTVEILNYNKELNLVFLSDIHLSELRNLKYVEKIVKEVNKYPVDCILIGGDTLESYMEYVENKGFEKVLAKMKSKYGTYGVLGNHEYIGDIDKNIEYLDRCGIKILRDKSIIIKKLEFIFRDEVNNKSRKKLKEIYISNYPKVVIDHRPKLSESLDEGIELQLSGHTHGGQFFPVNLIYMLRYRVIYGYKKIKNTMIIVSSGVGTGFFTYRTWSRSEIVRIKIKGKKI